MNLADRQFEARSWKDLNAMLNSLKLYSSYDFSMSSSPCAAFVTLEKQVNFAETVFISVIWG